VREPEKVVSVRIPEGLYAQLRGLALIDNRTLADVIRDGLALAVESRRSSPDFDDQVAAARVRQAEALAVMTNAST
jgi:hypothetical protein